MKSNEKSHPGRKSPAGALPVKSREKRARSGNGQRNEVEDLLDDDLLKEFGVSEAVRQEDEAKDREIVQLRQAMEKISRQMTRLSEENQRLRQKGEATSRDEYARILRFEAEITARDETLERMKMALAKHNIEWNSIDSSTISSDSFADRDSELQRLLDESLQKRDAEAQKRQKKRVVRRVVKKKVEAKPKKEVKEEKKRRIIFVKKEPAKKKAEKEDAEEPVKKQEVKRKEAPKRVVRKEAKAKSARHKASDGDEKRADKVAEQKPTEKPREQKQTEKPPEKPVDKQAEKQTEKQAEKPREQKPVEKVVEVKKEEQPERRGVFFVGGALSAMPRRRSSSLEPKGDKGGRKRDSMALVNISRKTSRQEKIESRMARRELQRCASEAMYLFTDLVPGNDNEVMSCDCDIPGIARIESQQAGESDVKEMPMSFYSESGQPHQTPKRAKPKDLKPEPKEKSSPKAKGEAQKKPKKVVKKRAESPKRVKRKASPRRTKPQ